MPRFSDISTEFLTENQMNYAKQVFPLRVVLISESGEMFTLWLPETMEGRYRFTDSSGTEVFPFYFEHTDNQWVASLYDGAFFFRGKKNGATEKTGAQQILSSMSAYRIQYKNEKFVLYVEEEHPGDHVFLPYYVEERIDYTIGRIAGNDIIYPNPGVSRDHARLHWNGASWSIIDLDSTNGTFVNGKKITNEPLRVGDIIFIVGLYIIVGVGYLSINNLNNRISINTPRIRGITSDHDLKYSSPTVLDGTYKFFDRAPRKYIKIAPESIVIEQPPMPLSGNNIPLLLRLGTPMLMGGSALMSGNFLMAMTSMVMPALTQGLTEKDRKEYEKKRLEKYREYLDYLKNEINKEKYNEEQQLNNNYPPLNTVLQMVCDEICMWDRRTTDEDFLSVRLGYGSIPMIAEKKYPDKRFQMERDVLEDEMFQLAETEITLNNVPILHSFLTDNVVGITGRRQIAFQFVKNCILQLVSSHSYDEVKIVLIADADDAKYFEFVRYLPHNWDNERNIRFFITSQSDAQQFTNHLNNEFEEYYENNKRFEIKNNTSYIVFSLSKNLFSHTEYFKKVLSDNQFKGVSLVTYFDGLPKECSKVIHLSDNNNRIVDYLNPGNSDQLFQLDKCDSALLYRGVNKIVSTKLSLDESSYMLPNMVTFLEMFNAGRVEHLNPLKRWAENNPVKSLAAPVGVGTDGELFYLDLHEKYQGPHGLVAGMTGSGKSEFLITYILSMAVNYSPDEVAFVLIDYKGGGLADAFEDPNRGIHLPHVVGTITNLDGAAINRSLMSIKSELRRRQAVFKKAKSQTNEGTMDIYDYQKLYRRKIVTEPMPHLLIISDEFAEMKAQQPEFMNELISTARIGRSLGVHLILATQKPSGVVNDQIRSNTKFQVCLRVQDRSDSMDMIKRPDAAELKHTGRFYLQVGYDEFFAQGQSAWCGAEYTPQDEVQAVKDDTVEFLDNIGQVLHQVAPEVKKETTGKKQIVSIVTYLSDLAKRENIANHQLWLESLPKKIDYDQALSVYASAITSKEKLVLGLVDDPERQLQLPFVLDLNTFHHMLICGNSASGKSTFIRTVLLECVERFSPEEFNYYILDLSSGALNAFDKLVHCGAYLTDSNETDINRMLDLIKEITNERKQLFAQADVTNFNEYTQLEKIPVIFVIFDGYTNIKNLNKGNEYFTFMHEYLIECANYGIHFIFSCNHPNEISAKCKQEIDYRVSLKAKDRYEYTDILDVKCSLTPEDTEGRGVCVVDGRALEYQAIMPYCNDSAQEQTSKLRVRLKETIEKNSTYNTARRLLMMKEGQTYEEFCSGFETNQLPLGYFTKDMKKIAMPFQQLYELSVYFGNPKGIKPVISNFLEAAQHNDMDLLIMRKQTDSLFDSQFETEIRSYFSGNLTLFDTNEEGIIALTDFFVEEITKRNVYRDEFCKQNGIPSTDKNRVKRATRYIRDKTKPLFVLFESFGDLCRQSKDENAELELCAFLSKTKGYNIYFTGCFYPNEEGAITNNALMKCFNKDEVLLLFGGQYDKQNMTNLPMDYRRIDQVNPNYDRYLFKYRGEYYTILMPCGQLDDNNEPPDEASII